MTVRRGTLARALFLFGALAPVAAHATPRISLREGLPCRACHENPSGGGMRTAYGRSVFAQLQLPMRPLAQPPAFDGELAHDVALGADLRFVYLYQRPGQPRLEPINSFAVMQADLYLSARFADQLTLYVDQGLFGSWEAMAIWELPWNLYLKAGRFMPSFGLRLDNHQVFTRQGIGFGARDKDVGLEAGARVGPVLLQLAVLNGEPPDVGLFDGNSSKAVVGRVEWQGGDELRALAGVSGYHNLTGRYQDKGTADLADDVDDRARDVRLSGHLGLSLGPLAYLGEASVRLQKALADTASGKTRASFQSYSELSVQVRRGLDVALLYEYQDPDLDTQPGAIHRIGGLAELFPIASCDLWLLYRHAAGQGHPLDGSDEIFGMLHAFF